MTQGLTRRGALMLGAGLLAMPHVARAQAHRVRFTLDWTFHGAYSFVAAGEKQGIFRDAGLDISVVRGYGSGRVPVDLAAGTYDVGIADCTPAMRFLAENPGRDIVAIAMLYEGSPLCATVRADGPITEPKMLAGRTLAAPEFDGGRQVFPVFAQAIGINLNSIRWMSVSPELREPMLVQRRADGITGFITSTGMSLKALGMDWPQQRIFRYRDYGLDFYGSALLTTRTFLREKPEAAKATILAMMRALRWSYHNPDKAVADLKARESLTDVPIEAERQQVAFREMLVTPDVRKHGLSHVEPARMQRQLDAVKGAFGLATMPSVAEFYTDAYLPAAAERML